MAIEIKELIIQALIGAGEGRKKTDNKAEEKKKQAQLDVTEIVSEMLKKQNER